MIFQIWPILRDRRCCIAYLCTVLGDMPQRLQSCESVSNRGVSLAVLAIGLRCLRKELAELFDSPLSSGLGTFAERRSDAP